MLKTLKQHQDLLAAEEKKAIELKEKAKQVIKDYFSQVKKVDRYRVQINKAEESGLKVFDAN